MTLSERFTYSTSEKSKYDHETFEQYLIIENNIITDRVITETVIPMERTHNFSNELISY